MVNYSITIYILYTIYDQNIVKQSKNETEALLLQPSESTPLVSK